MTKVGRLELHSDKAFGKILEHRHICETLIDFFRLFFDNINFVSRSMFWNFGVFEAVLHTAVRRVGWVRISVQEVFEVSRYIKLLSGVVRF